MAPLERFTSWASTSTVSGNDDDLFMEASCPSSEELQAPCTTPLSAPPRQQLSSRLHFLRGPICAESSCFHTSSFSATHRTAGEPLPGSGSGADLACPGCPSWPQYFAASWTLCAHTPPHGLTAGGCELPLSGHQLWTLPLPISWWCSREESLRLHVCPFSDGQNEAKSLNFSFPKSPAW